MGYVPMDKAGLPRGAWLFLYAAGATVILNFLVEVSYGLVILDD